MEGQQASDSGPGAWILLGLVSHADIESYIDRGNGDFGVEEASRSERLRSAVSDSGSGASNARAICILSLEQTCAQLFHQTYDTLMLLSLHKAIKRGMQRLEASSLQASVPQVVVFPFDGSWSKASRSLRVSSTAAVNHGGDSISSRKKDTVVVW